MSESTMNEAGNDGGSVTVGLPEIVERVARALCRQYSIDEGYTVESAERDAASDMHKHFKAAARAAMEAMREPTAAMIEAEPPDDGEFNKENSAAHAKAFWQAMIDAALFAGCSGRAAK